MLAKLYHPDLNRSLDSEKEVNQGQKMAELLEAYDALINCTDFEYSRLGSNRLATLCELNSLEELKKYYDLEIFKIEITFEDKQRSTLCRMESSTFQQETENSLQAEKSYQIECHSGDSITDIRQICERNKSLKILKGKSWELIKICGEEHESNIVLSYHLFLRSYGISDGSVIYAITEKTK